MNILQIKNDKGEWVGISSIQGPAGKDATINGVNTLEIKAGQNVTITQDGNVLTINVTAATMEQVNAAISAAITGAIEGAY